MPDLNRLLSEMIEPMPTQELAYMSLYALSEKKGWRWMYSNTGVGSWQPRAWDTDENASAQIFDMMPEPILQYDAASKQWGCKAKRDYDTKTYEWDPERKKAVRAAAYEWLTHRREHQQ